MVPFKIPTPSFWNERVTLLLRNLSLEFKTEDESLFQRLFLHESVSLQIWLAGTFRAIEWEPSYVGNLAKQNKIETLPKTRTNKINIVKVHLWCVIFLSHISYQIHSPAYVTFNALILYRGAGSVPLRKCFSRVLHLIAVCAWGNQGPSKPPLSDARRGLRNSSPWIWIHTDVLAWFCSFNTENVFSIEQIRAPAKNGP
jgi:hypothetical protein